jgi:SMI1 / KNR4 family (SUKH-1)
MCGPLERIAMTSATIIEALAQRAREGRLTASLKRGPWAKTLNPPVSLPQVTRAEAQLRFALPPLLRDLYTKVANGGFGPGYGLFGVPIGTAAERYHGEQNIVEAYEAFRRRRTRHEPWAHTFLPICYWGASFYSYLDCALPDAPVMALDAMSRGEGPWGSAVGLHAASFEEWMQCWVEGQDLWESFNAVGKPKFRFEEAQAPYLAWNVGRSAAGRGAKALVRIQARRAE